MFSLFKKSERLDIAEKILERDKRFNQQYQDALKIHTLEKVVAFCIMVIVVFIIYLQLPKYKETTHYKEYYEQNR